MRSKTYGLRKVSRIQLFLNSEYIHMIRVRVVECEEAGNGESVERLNHVVGHVTYQQRE